MDLRKLFAERFADGVGAFGFRPGDDMLYLRERGELHDVVIAGLRPSGDRGFALGLGSVGLLLPEIERLRSRLGLTRRNATVSVGLHLLLPDKLFREWAVTEAADIEQAVPEMLRIVGVYGLPFLQSFASIGDVKERLSVADSAAWFNCSEDSRGVLLVLIEASQGDQESAVELCRKLLSPLQARAPKYSHELRLLLANLKVDHAY